MNQNQEKKHLLSSVLNCVADTTVTRCSFGTEIDPSISLSLDPDNPMRSKCTSPKATLNSASFAEDEEDEHGRANSYVGTGGYMVS